MPIEWDEETYGYCNSCGEEVPMSIGQCPNECDDGEIVEYEDSQDKG